MLPGPGPDSPKEPAIQSGPSQIVQQTGDLVLFHAGGRVTKVKRDSGTHSGRTEGMRTVVASDDPIGLAGVRIVVETEKGSGKGARD